MFGLYFDFKIRNKTFADDGVSLLIIRFHTDFKLHVYLGTGIKVCGGWVVVLS